LKAASESVAWISPELVAAEADQSRAQRRNYSHVAADFGDYGNKRSAGG
jgi:hypothetical protein